MGGLGGGERKTKKMEASPHPSLPLSLPHLAHAQQDVARHPQLVTHLDADAGADLLGWVWEWWVGSVKTSVFQNKNNTDSPSPPNLSLTWYSHCAGMTSAFTPEMLMPA